MHEVEKRTTECRCCICRGLATSVLVPVEQLEALATTLDHAAEAVFAGGSMARFITATRLTLLAHKMRESFGLVKAGA